MRCSHIVRCWQYYVVLRALNTEKCVADCSVRSQQVLQGPAEVWLEITLITPGPIFRENKFGRCLDCDVEVMEEIEQPLSESGSEPVERRFFKRRTANTARTVRRGNNRANAKRHGSLCMHLYFPTSALYASTYSSRNGIGKRHEKGNHSKLLTTNKMLPAS